MSLIIIVFYISETLQMWVHKTLCPYLYHQKDGCTRGELSQQWVWFSGCLDCMSPECRSNQLHLGRVPRTQTCLSVWSMALPLFRILCSFMKTHLPALHKYGCLPQEMCFHHLPLQSWGRITWWDIWCETKRRRQIFYCSVKFESIRHNWSKPEQK